MSALIANVRQWWSLRSVREQRMLGVMALLIAVTLVWLLGVRPLLEWRDRADERLGGARSDRVLVLTAIRRLAVQRDDSPSAGGDLTAIVQESANAAGLNIALGMDSGGGLGFDAPSISSAQVFTWLSALKAQHSVETKSLSIIENADATLHVTGSF